MSIHTDSVDQRGALASSIGSALLWIVSVIGAVATIALLLVPKFFLPAEDAVILFQFSRNLAQTGAITYVTNGSHAEGATDFLWMVLISGGIKLGIDPFWFVAAINGVFLVILGMVLLKIAGRRIELLPLLFVMGAFALMPQIFACVAGFSTLPFASLFAILAFYFLRRNDVAVPLISLVLCLFRPDGVVFAVPLLISALVIYSGRLRRVALDFGLFVLPGIGYFIWRWKYFGELLPLPFLVKSNVHRFAHLIVMSSYLDGRLFCVFAFLLLFLLLWKRLGSVENRVMLLCLVVLPNFFYFAMRLDQDIGYRLFIYLPAGTAILIAMNADKVCSRRSYFLPFAFMVWAVVLRPLWVQELSLFRIYQFDSRKAIAEQLSRLHHGTLITTEAGIITYYSHWTAYDPWGLNTEQYSKSPFQPSEVSRLRPDAILVHAYPGECFVQSDWSPPYSERTWTNMTRNIVAGADAAHYEMWLLPFGSLRRRAAHHMQVWEGEQDCWFVRADSPLRAAVGSGAGVYRKCRFSRWIGPSKSSHEIAQTAKITPKSRNARASEIRLWDIQRPATGFKILSMSIRREAT